VREGLSSKQTGLSSQWHLTIGTLKRFRIHVFSSMLQLVTQLSHQYGPLEMEMIFPEKSARPAKTSISLLLFRRLSCERDNQIKYRSSLYHMKRLMMNHEDGTLNYERNHWVLIDIVMTLRSTLMAWI